MTNILKGAIFYFLGVFAMGFVLGALRNVFLVTYTGPMIAVLIEIPFILLFSWYFCLLLTGKLAIPPDVHGRLVMGGVAFACLVTGEILIAMLLQHGRMTDYLLSFDLPENRIGLVGQIAFALFPVIQGYGQARGKR
jgi:hypothetical protein